MTNSEVLTARNSAERAAIVGILGRIYGQLKDGEITGGEAASRALDALAPATQSRKATWNSVADHTEKVIRDAVAGEYNGDIGWAIMQWGMIFLSYEI